MSGSESDSRLPAGRPWPRAARVLALLAKPEDRGLGDVAQRMASRLGGEWLKSAIKALLGHDCGCASRQQKMNELYPLQ
jgi:hypothetical protein